MKRSRLKSSRLFSGGTWLKPLIASALPRIAMIEFEDYGIAFAAINAGMSREVVEYLLTALLAVELPLFGGALQVIRPVASIVLA